MKRAVLVFLSVLLLLLAGGYAFYRLMETKETPAQGYRPSDLDSAITALPGLTHYFPLTAATQSDDVVGGVHGSNYGAVFTKTGAVFDGKSYIELPDDKAYSVNVTGQLTVLVFQTVTDWHGAGGNGEYINWMGKGEGSEQEWTFRHYVQDSIIGDAPERQFRESVYHFNPEGKLGAGSFFQDSSVGTSEGMLTAQFNQKDIELWKDGTLRQTSSLADFDVVPQNLSAPVRIGTRDLVSGFLVGKVRKVAFFNRPLTDTEIAKIYQVYQQKG